MKTDRDNLIERFLLGKLTDEESLQIEKDFFSSNDLFEDILIAENDLIDAYAAGSLSSEDRNRFESRLLLSAQQRRRVRFAETLLRYAANSPLPAGNFEPLVRRQSWISVIRQFISDNRKLSFSFAAAALIFFIGAISLKLYNFNPAGDQTNEIAESRIPRQLPENKPVNGLNNSNEIVEIKPEAAPSPVRSVLPKPAQNKPARPQNNEVPIVYSLILSPGLTRDAGASQKLTIPAKTKLVKMRLNFEEGSFSSYHAALETVEGTQVWRSNKLKAQTSDNAVVVLIPADFLQKSDYILTLKGVTKEGIYENVESYAFTVNR